MKIGFPIVVDGDQSNVICVLLSREPSGKGIGLECSGIESCELSAGSFPSTSYEALVVKILALGGRLKVELSGGRLEDRLKVLDLLPNESRLRFGGQSGTLALYVLWKLEPLNMDNKTTFYLTGGILERQDVWSITALANPIDMQKKINALSAHAVWLLRDDYDGLESKAESAKPFDAPGGSTEWLIAELCDHYSLTHPPQKKVEPPSEPTELKLYKAAISSYRLERRDACFDRHFQASPARALTEIQAQALDPEKVNNIFWNPEVPGQAFLLRHLVISGPTGSGKTTLLHSLVLNGLHNRGGGVLYVGPVKALVEEFFHTITESLSDLLPAESEQRIVLSTGDHSLHDSWISCGRFGLACLVNEKANVIFSASDAPHELLSRLTMVIVDELHMLQDQSRGGVLDLLIAKVAREATRRAVDGVGSPLQMVLVSTEKLDTIIKNMPSMLANPDDENSIPVSLSTDLREIWVSHKVAVIPEQARAGSEWYMRDVTTFKSNQDRRLTFKQREEKIAGLGPHGKAEQNVWQLAPRSTSGPHIESQLRSLIIAVLMNHQSVLVALGSVASTFRNAKALADNLKHPLYEHGPFTHFEKELRQAGLPPDLTRAMLGWSRRGVFVHNSQLPPKLRRAIEAVFREDIKPNSRPKLLLATETLTYGVNLSVSCVILSTLLWTRDDPMDPFKPPSSDHALDQNQFHNLLGRAGRKGKMRAGQLAEAIVCMPVSKFQKTTDRANFLTAYYSEDLPPRKLFSSIAQSTELDWFRFDREAGKYGLQVARHKKLTDYSYSAFRSTLDALRAVGRDATEDEVMEIIERTVAYQYCNQQQDKTTQGKLLGLAKAILGQAAEYKKGGILLVEKNGGMFAAMPAASALIDTGTTLHSVEPIAIWLELLNDRAGIGLFSGRAEAVLPGLIAAPDFTRTACELVPGSHQLESLAQQVAAERLDKSSELAQNELSLLGLGELRPLIDKFLEKEEIKGGLKIVPVINKRAIVYWQLLAATLRWLRGCNEDLIREPLNLFNKGQAAWLPKHAERVEQLAKMCYRFFERSEGYLTEQQMLGLPQLALRLKYGIPFAATPYLNIFSSEGVLPREAVMSLFDVASDPFLLLKGEAAQLDAVNARIVSIESNVQTVNDVIEVVRKTYYASTNSFFSSLERDDAQTFVAATRDALLSDPDRAFSLDWNARLLLAKKFLSHRELSDAALVVTMGDNEYRRTMEVEASDAAKVCFFSGENGALRPTPSDIQVLGWHQVCDGMSITPCAYVLLIGMLLRRLVLLSEFTGKLTEIKDLRIDVYWIASNLWQAPNLIPLQALRESLLSFMEPKQMIEIKSPPAYQ